MCGICGLTSRIEDREENERVLLDMLDNMEHRGPDHRGYLVESRLALGNQRLKIIDLEGGNQPVTNEDGTITVIYNGEIYNFQELKKELLKQGHVFKSKSDTEVLVHLYEEWGTDMLPMLNGMFAFALHDRRRDVILIARDRFGIKPLFYTQTPKGFFFSSELRSLSRIPSFDFALDFQAISIFLAQLFIPQPWSIFKNTKRLKAGHYLLLKSDGVEEHCYYDFDFTKKEKMTEKDAEEEIIRLLTASVKRQLVSDVPVAVFLSSGLDSTTLLAMSALGGAALDSFTLSYDEAIYDENYISSRWAEVFSKEHHRVVMQENDFLKLLDNRMAHIGEPLGIWINVGSEMISRAAIAHGFKVVLNGSGGDEFFCGYPTLNAAVIAKYYKLIPDTIRDGVIKKLTNLLPAGDGALPLTFMIKSFINAIDDDVFKTFMNFKMVIGPKHYKNLLTEKAQELIKGYEPYAAFDQYRKKTGNMNMIDALSYLDIKCFMEGCCLYYNDNATMATSLEERVPFLDNGLAEFACKVPVNLRFNLYETKTLLKKSMKNHLKQNGSSDLLKGYKKHGMELPGNTWIREGQFGKYLHHKLSKKNITNTGFFDYEGIQNILDNHISRKSNNERILQAILGLSIFLEKI
jgi:asparagine synthase (glutamine-hydrolysing)